MAEQFGRPDVSQGIIEHMPPFAKLLHNAAGLEIEHDSALLRPFGGGLLQTLHETGAVTLPGSVKPADELRFRADLVNCIRHDFGKFAVNIGGIAFGTARTAAVHLIVKHMADTRSVVLSEHDIDHTAQIGNCGKSCVNDSSMYFRPVSVEVQKKPNPS